MRILGFSKKWDKLNNDTFTTFRFKRHDKRDWFVGEIVQIVYKPRSKEREVLGIAKIENKELKDMSWAYKKLAKLKITNAEANEDGFPDGYDKHGYAKSGYLFMCEWLFDTYGEKLSCEPMNKLTLCWLEKE